MRRIMVLNTKGGSGKTMLATNLASYFTNQYKSVTLADLDPQGSSIAWLESRPEDHRPIRGIAAWEEVIRVPLQTDYLIMDTPAASRGKDLTALVRRAQTVLIPVQPSATDMRAAAKFIHDLLLVGKISRKEVKLALVANRLRESGAIAGTIERLLGSIRIPFTTERTEVNQTLEDFLKSLKVPLIASLHDSENYLRADALGVGIFELSPSQTERDQHSWQPLLQWLNSRRSIPRKKRKNEKRGR